MGWAAPVAQVAGAIGGALIGRSGQGQAIKSQERAAMQQIALERERDAARGQRYNTAMTAYNQEKQQYDQMRRALLAHYGVNMGGAPGGGTPSPAGDVKGPMGSAGVSPMSGGVSLGALMGGGSAPAPAAGDPAAAAARPDEPVPLVDEGDAFDWRRYGAR
jgi:hypothetical protein